MGCRPAGWQPFMHSRDPYSSAVLKEESPPGPTPRSSAGRWTGCSWTSPTGGQRRAWFDGITTDLGSDFGAYEYVTNIGFAA